MIYTASFESYRLQKTANLAGVSIARRVPAWFKPPRWIVRECKTLAPRAFFDKAVRGEARDFAWQNFVEYYLRQLERLDAFEMLRALREKVNRGEEIALLCWERDPEYCHRRLVGDWLERETKQIVIELDVVKNETPDRGETSGQV
jgi:uncharacterized protein YeaO (DUF488 family)